MLPDVEPPFQRKDGFAVYSCCWVAPEQSCSCSNTARLITIFYFLKFETSPIWKAGFLLLFLPNNQKFLSKLKLFCDRRSVSQSVLVSDIHLASMTIVLRITYYRRIFTVFVLWGALPDERAGLIFTHTSATGPCQRCHFRFHVSWNRNHMLLSQLRLDFLSVAS
jgi:hypothetical protein